MKRHVLHAFDAVVTRATERVLDCVEARYGELVTETATFLIENMSAPAPRSAPPIPFSMWDTLLGKKL